jgi:Spy/CpxP family protein refolding chaperone
MVTKKNLLILFLVLLTVVNVAALATIAYHRFHAQRPFHPMERPEGRVGFLKQKLGLSEEQAKKFESHMERFRTETEPIYDSLSTMRTELMSEMMGKEPDVKRLNRLAEEIGALEIKLKKKSITHMLEGKTLLTPEQQRKFFSHFREGLEQIHPMRDHGKRFGR